jgi:hypothetical protein
MMNKKTEQWRNACVGQPLETEKRALLGSDARFLAALGEGNQTSEVRGVLKEETRDRGQLRCQRETRTPKNE